MAGERGSGGRWERIGVFAGAGALVTLAGAWLQPRLRGAAPRPGNAAIWVGDRDGGKVQGLDSERFLAWSATVPFPLELAARRDGGLWVLAGGSSPTDLERRLLRLTDRGELATEIPLRGASGLVALDGADALLIAESPGGRSLTRVGGNGAAAPLVSVAPGAAIAAGPAGILVSDERGIRVLGAGSAGPSAGRALSPVAPCADGWWGVERGEEGGLLLRLDRNLSRVRTRPLAELGLRETTRLRLAPVSDGCLWIVDSRGAAVRVGPGAEIRARGTLPLPGPQACAATEEGALLVIVPGALLRLDPSGRPEPGQGGFDYLVGLAVADGGRFGR